MSPNTRTNLTWVVALSNGAGTFLGLDALACPSWLVGNASAVVAVGTMLLASWIGLIGDS